MNWQETVMSEEDIDIASARGRDKYCQQCLETKHPTREHEIYEAGDKAVAEAQAKATWEARQKEVDEAEQRGIRKVVEAGDALLCSVYWRGKFSTAEIRQFWNQLREKGEYDKHRK